MNKLPAWFKQPIPDKGTLSWATEFGIHTVCQEARCPNLGECFKNSRLTFMILGGICTRNCRFCAVEKRDIQPLAFDAAEPWRVAQAVKELGLRYVIITAVTRDDLADGGAGQFAQTLELIHQIDREIKVEVLIPDFQGRTTSLQRLLAAQPAVVAHNLETPRRLYQQVRPKADYALSLGLLGRIKRLQPSVITKSSLILGLGENEPEVIATMQDLRRSQCDILTLGQYLAPSFRHYPVKEFISEEQFHKFKEIGLTLGFLAVLSGPRVRSSYQAEELYRELKEPCMM